MTVSFPWGSLLRGLIGGSSSVVGPIASLMKPEATLCVLISTVDRDGVGEVTPSVIAAQRGAYAAHGLHLVVARWATDVDVAASHSAWAKRLVVGRGRPAVIARYRRDGT